MSPTFSTVHPTVRVPSGSNERPACDQRRRTTSARIFCNSSTTSRRVILSGLGGGRPVAIQTGELRRAGRVVYGVRAFEQDAQEAMRGDIVRGLIELVTNSDDAYARMGDVAGKIRIEVEHRRGAAWRV